MEKKIPVYWAVIGGLALIFICVSTSVLCGKPNAVQYIGFAATITSLFLGVIAIVYSFITNSQSSQNIGALTDASNKVMEGGIKISGISESIDVSVKSLTAITDSLNQNLEKLPDHLQGMKEDLSKIFTQNITSSSHDRSKSTEFKGDFYEGLLSNASFAAIIVMSAVCIAFDKKIQLDLEKLSKSVFQDDVPSLQLYFGGYLGCLKSISLLEGDLLESGKKYNIKFINENFKKYIESFVIDYEKKETQWENEWKKMQDYLNTI